MAHSAKLLNSLSQNNSCLCNDHYHMNKSNKRLTQRHTGLSGARCKVNHQTASTQLAPKGYHVTLRTTHTDAMKRYHLNKSNWITHFQHRTNLNGKRLHHKYTKGDHWHSITSPELLQQRKIWSSKSICAPETNFLLYQHHYTPHSGAWCKVTQQTVPK